MARVELIMPKMGESVSEATVIAWTKEVGDMVELDETIIEIATDKVDSEVPSTHEGKLIEKLFEADDLVQVGQPFAILEIDGGDDTSSDDVIVETKLEVANEIINKSVVEKDVNQNILKNSGDRFYSPLVRSMATKEKISNNELENIIGSGKDGRVTKSDMISFLDTRKNTFKTLF